MIHVAPNSFEALTSALYPRQPQPTAEPVVATDIHAAALAAGFDERTSRAIGFDPRITERNLLEAAIAEAKEIRDLAAFATRTYPPLAEAYDLQGVASDFIRQRLPLSQLRYDIAAKVAAMDEHIDTAPKKGQTEVNSMATSVWQKRKGATK
jgi:hypothetical protein